MTNFQHGRVIQANAGDCVVVALANYTGKDYDYCMQVVCSVSGRNKGEILERGTPSKAVELALSLVQGRVCKVVTPKPLSDCYLSGIGHWYYDGRDTGKLNMARIKHGHANVVSNGKVYDTNGKTYTMSEYKAKGWKLYKIYS